MRSSSDFDGAFLAGRAICAFPRVTSKRPAKSEEKTKAHGLGGLAGQCEIEVPIVTTLPAALTGANAPAMVLNTFCNSIEGAFET